MKSLWASLGSSMLRKVLVEFMQIIVIECAHHNFPFCAAR